MAKRLLIRRIASERTLQRAWNIIAARRKAASYGVDGQSVADFRADARREIRELRKELLEGTYKPKGYRGFPLTKKSGKERPISVPTVRDAIVQRATLDIIWPKIRNDLYTPGSYGGLRPYKTKNDRYRREDEPLRNVVAAAKRIRQFYEAGLDHTFETDIIDFFGHIDKGRLLEQLYARLEGDRTLAPIFDAAISTSVDNKHELGRLAELWDEQRGVPQGASLSPVFANLYLADFDREIDRAGFRMTRYIDDLIIQTRTSRDASEAHRLVKSLLMNKGLCIHDLESGTKTRIVDKDSPFDFLGLTFSRNAIKPYGRAYDRLRERIDQITDAHSGDYPHLLAIISGANRLLGGWLNSYFYCNLSKKELGQIDHFVRQRVGGWMKYHGLISRKKPIDSDAQRLLGLREATSQHIQPIVRR